MQDSDKYRSFVFRKKGVVIFITTP